MLAKLNAFNYALTQERDIFLLVSQPTYRRHLSILKRRESIHPKERNTLTKCHSVLIKVHSAPKLQHMSNKRKHFLDCIKLHCSFFFVCVCGIFGCEKVLGKPSSIISHDISFLKKGFTWFSPSSPLPVTCGLSLSVSAAVKAELAETNAAFRCSLIFWWVQ